MEQREIKFRAWDSEAKVMSGEFSLFGEFTLMAAVHDWQMEIRGIDTVFENGDGPNLIEMLSELKIMQFTGLKDKNGKEIYEGDIVRFHANYSSNPCGYMNGLVTFKHLQWMIRSGTHLYSIYEETDEFENKSEIIGNAYENPELIN